MPDDYNDIAFQQMAQQMRVDFILSLLVSLCVGVFGKGVMRRMLETWMTLMIGVDTSNVSALDSERYIRAVWKVHDEIEKRLE